MNFLFSIPANASIPDRIQARMLRLAAFFLFLFGAILTLSPAVRAHSWTVEYRWQHWIGFAAWLLVFSVLHRETRRRLSDRDPFLLPIAALLTGWGLLTIWRISSDYGLRQTVWLLACGLIFAVGLRLPNLLILLRRYKYLWLTGGIALTALTFLFGTYPGGYGPRLWLGCCGVYVQPSEPLKLLLIVYLAAYLADYLLINFHPLRLLLPTLALLGLTSALLLAQHDLGTAVLFLFLYAAILYTASGLRRIVAVGGLLVAAGAVFAYFNFDVVRLRFDAWLNPWLDPSGRSFQIVQSLITFSAGGILGRGPGLGSPGVVPVVQSDFIFAAIAEEAGLVGAVAIVVLVALVLARGLRVAFHAAEPYQRYLAAGLTCYLVGQSILIIAGNLRLLPLTGVTLPFVSYGGSSLVTSYFSLLLLIQISDQPEEEPAGLPNPTPYLNLSVALLAGLFAIALATGWWSVYRGPELAARSDNPRKYIEDRYVQRGSLLDRNDVALDATSGRPGSFTRTNSYPPLSPILGYTNPIYGQAGLEASLDPYLRGLEENSAWLIAWDRLTYGQPPPGVDVRLTLDLHLQRAADTALGANPGSLVLLNARSGEILAMASHPYFDSNRLDQDFQDLIQNPNSPLLNRASQGQYPPGTAVGPFLLAEALRRSSLPTLPQNLAYTNNGDSFACAQAVDASATWPQAVGAGCPGALVSLGKMLGGTNLLALYSRLGFYTTPQTQLPASAERAPAELTEVDRAAIGRGSVTVSPLQMALAAAGFSLDGVRPAPRIVISTQTPSQGWAVLPIQGEKVQEYPAGLTADIAGSLAAQGTMTWQATGRSSTADKKPLTWFIGGTLPNWQGTPLAIALVLESDNTPLAQQVGASVLTAGMH